MRSAQEAAPTPNISRRSMQALKFLKLAIAVLDSMANRLANQGGLKM